MSMRAAWSAEIRKHPPVMTCILITGLPLGIAGLKGLGFLIRKTHLLQQQRFHWQAFLQAGHMEFVQMLVPLTLASWAAYLCWNETEANAWKWILAQPISRTQVILAKLAILGCWLLAFLCLHGLAQLGVGAWLFRGQTPPVGVFADALLLAPLFLAPILVVQLWLSLRFSNPMVPLGICLLANLLVLLTASSWEYILPWHYVQYMGLPSRLGLPKMPFALASACLCLTAALWDFRRKDIV